MVGANRREELKEPSKGTGLMEGQWALQEELENSGKNGKRCCKLEKKKKGGRGLLSI